MKLPSRSFFERNLSGSHKLGPVQREARTLEMRKKTKDATEGGTKTITKSSQRLGQQTSVNI